MEFRHLRTFLAVAEHLHFGRAAQQIHLSQPAITVQIRSLEVELGVRLFIRNRRRTTLTLAGELLMVDARDILLRAEAATLRASRADSGQVGILRIGMISTAAGILLPPVALEFRKNYPEVRLDLENILTATQIERLRNKQIDIGFVRMPVSDDNIRVLALHSEPFMLLLPASHRLARNPRISMKDLSKEDFVMYSRSKAPAFCDRIIGMLERAGVKPRIVQEASEMHTLVSLVAAGMGIAILPKSVERYSISGVVSRELPGRLPQSMIGIAFHRESVAPFVREFVELARRIHLKGRSRSTPHS